MVTKWLPALAGLALSGCVAPVPMPAVPPRTGGYYGDYGAAPGYLVPTTPLPPLSLGWGETAGPNYSSQRAYDLNMANGYQYNVSPYNRAMRQGWW